MKKLFWHSNLLKIFLSSIKYFVDRSIIFNDMSMVWNFSSQIFYFVWSAFISRNEIGNRIVFNGIFENKIKRNGFLAHHFKHHH